MRNLFRRLLGNRGEDTAAAYLKRQGLKILARQHRNHYGEIDLIARDGKQIVFVEVKTRSGADHGRPEDAVNDTKQRKIVQAALCWLKQKRRLRQPVRFDIVSILWPDPDREPLVNHYPNAFESSQSGQFFG